jgi:hypothetical protein
VLAAPLAPRLPAFVPPHSWRSEAARACLSLSLYLYAHARRCVCVCVCPPRRARTHVGSPEPHTDVYMPFTRASWDSVKGDLKASMQAKVKQYKLDLGVSKETMDNLTRKVPLLAMDVGHVRPVTVLYTRGVSQDARSGQRRRMHWNPSLPVHSHAHARI